MVYYMKIIFFLIGIIFFNSVSFAQEKKESDQQIKGFNFIQYKDGGAEKLKLNGESAEVEDNNIKIDDISAISFGEKSALKLKAREGNFNKGESLVHLKDNVVVTATDGTTLFTDHLDWNTETKNASTDSPISIKKADLKVDGKGVFCNLEDKTAELKEDVNVSIASLANEDSSAPDVLGSSEPRTIITCDGPLELNYKKNHAIFHNNVRVEDSRGNILADRMDVYFSIDTRRVKCVLARGNVRIINGENITYSEKAIYLVDQGRVILPNRPKLVIKNNAN